MEQPVGRTPELVAISRQTIVRVLLTVALLACGIVTVRVLEAAMQATFNKPPAPLQQPLKSMSTALGSPPRYVSARPDEILDPEVVETLGTSEYVMRQYTDTSLKPGTPGSLINLNVNYYATGSSTPHVPEICWAAAGRQEVGNSRKYFDVNGIRRSDGTSVDLRMRLISFLPAPNEATTNADGEPIYTNVAYVFQVNGEYVSSPQEVTSRFWKAQYKVAYHSKIEVTPIDPADPQGQRPLNCTQAQAQALVSEFIRCALPELEKCLPDPVILTK